MANKTISAAGGNWGDNGTWDEGSPPTSAQNVVARGDGTSGNVVVTAGATYAIVTYEGYYN